MAVEEWELAAAESEWAVAKCAADTDAAAVGKQSTVAAAVPAWAWEDGRGHGAARERKQR